MCLLYFVLSMRQAALKNFMFSLNSRPVSTGKMWGYWDSLPGFRLFYQARHGCLYFGQIYYVCRFCVFFFPFRPFLLVYFFTGPGKLRGFFGFPLFPFPCSRGFLNPGFLTPLFFRDFLSPGGNSFFLGDLKIGFRENMYTPF